MDLQPPAVVISGRGWLDETRFANQLLRQGVRVLWEQQALEKGSGVVPGSLIVPLDAGYDAALAAPVDLASLEALAREAGITLSQFDPTPVMAYPLRPIRVGLYGGGGAPFNHAGVFGEAGFPLRFLSDAEIRAGDLATVDVLVMPGGGFRAMQGQLEPLGLEGTRRLTQWVRDGGMYIGSCAGAYDCAIAPAAFTRSCPPKGELQLVNARVWNGDGGELGGELEGLDSPGVGVLRLRSTRPDHPVMSGMPESFEVVHYNGPVFDVLETLEIDGASLAEGLAAFNGPGERFTAAEHFMGATEQGETTLLDRASAAGKYSIVAGELGIGRAVAFGSHPEFGFNLAMDEWGAPARMLVNAALWQAASRPVEQRRRWSYRDTPGPAAAPRGTSLALVQRLARQVAQDATALRQRSIDPLPRWLTVEYAMSVFGMTPIEIWCQSIDDIESLANCIVEQAAELGDRLATMGASDAEREVAMQIDRWMLEVRPAAWRQDGGYQGVAALLRTAHEMCRAASDRWDIELGPPAGPYDYFLENPYHLVAGSYLAAIGCVSGAVQLLRALTAEASLVSRTAGVPTLARQA
jgi:hypothetical protein